MTSIKSIKTTPLLVRDKIPYVWAQGVTYGAEVILIEIQTTDGVSGYGESIGAPLAAAVKPLIDMAAQHLIGERVFSTIVVLWRNVLNPYFSFMVSGELPDWVNKSLLD